MGHHLGGTAMRTSGRVGRTLLGALVTVLLLAATVPAVALVVTELVLPTANSRITTGGQADHDFTGEGVADLLWQNTVSGNVALWFFGLDGTVQGTAALGNVAGWLPAVGDFNGDGVADILWQNTTSGNVALWFMNGNGTVQSVVALGNISGWTPTVGDFNGDGVADILWQNNSSGNLAMWLMNPNGTVNSNTPLGTVVGWIPKVGDFNGDGVSDLLWQNVITGNASIWFMNNDGTVLSMVGIPRIEEAEEFEPTIGDFNGDGFADILWVNADGDVELWLMNPDGTVLTEADFGNILGWVPTVGDYNGDGMADIVWRDVSSGNLALWLMNGTTVTSVRSLGNAAGGWVTR